MGNDDFVRVPKHALPEMMNAGVAAARAELPDSRGRVGHLQVRAAYNAMIAAAPPSAPSGEPVAWRWRPTGTEIWVLWSSEPVRGANLVEDADVEIEPLYAAPPNVSTPSELEGSSAAAAGKSRGDGPSDEDIAQAIKATEYRYFGDYPMSDGQIDAVGVLCAAARALIRSRLLPAAASEGASPEAVDPIRKSLFDAKNYWADRARKAEAVNQSPDVAEMVERLKIYASDVADAADFERDNENHDAGRVLDQQCKFLNEAASLLQSLARERERLREALNSAKRLCDNINEFGHVTDQEIIDAAEAKIRSALPHPDTKGT